ncbi:MAG: hypothetical protein HY827_08010 [Actinobacteria bacterium]|nr:hypothetical protein [Actinomycetota bacterium]
MNEKRFRILKILLATLAIATLIAANLLTTRAVDITKQTIRQHPELLQPDGSCGACS